METDYGLHQCKAMVESAEKKKKIMYNHLKTKGSTLCIIESYILPSNPKKQPIRDFIEKEKIKKISEENLENIDKMYFEGGEINFDIILKNENELYDSNKNIQTNNDENVFRLDMDF